MMNKYSIAGFFLYQIFRLGWKKPDLLSIYFHNPSVDAFERIIKWVANHDYDFVEIPVAIDYMRGNLKDGKKHCIVTFDDAWQRNLKLIPVIEKYHVPITIFSPVEPLKNGNYWWRYVQAKGGVSLSEEFKTYPEAKFKEEVGKLKNSLNLPREAMTEEELREISKHSLVNIQSHSYSHPILTNLSDESLDSELRESKKYLEKEVGKKIFAFCYPNGSLTTRETDKAKELYDCAFSTIQANPQVGGDLYTIPRFALTDNYWSNLAKVIGAWDKFRRILR